ncbi:hypothetical protein FSP39_009689 [Pinctada imbricata]|uniref:C2H2-type domain-containing protein n=1 Tax=Pinctada imbricata TaxID=66713 RepID=A0AA88YI90_PINIB|nr:hypothetical protein FSP39_009689 [Pinctada imbricata]
MEDSIDNSEDIQYQSGDTITISLEDASQLMQGIEGGVLPPGTYHILTQEGYQLGDGSLDGSVGFTVVQSIPEGMTVSQPEPNEIHAEVIVIPPIKPPTPKVAPKSVTPKNTTKKVDLSQPIAVTQETEITLNGKKCILRPNPTTGQLCAYPVLPPDGKRRRGRPPKALLSESPGPQISSSLGRRVDPVLKEKSKDQTNAVEGLLELSNTGPDGIRRSGRARKKAKTLDDYEVTEVASDDDGTKQDIDDEDDDDAAKVIPSLRRKIKLEVENKDVLNITPYITPVNPAKRGRGRPRRYPPPANTPTQIPAVIIPGANGQTLMMAPIQGLSNFQAFQQQMKKLPEIITKTPVVSTITINPTTVPASVSPTETVTATSTIAMATSGSPTPDLPHSEADAITTQSSDVTMETDALTTQSSDVTMETITTETSVECTNVTQEESEDPNKDSEEADTSVEESVMVKEEMASPMKTVEETSHDDTTEKPDSERTIIQIPENLLPMFLPKNNPVKLGLKFSEKELDELKCQKCGYQAFYTHQYQTHIASHVDETQKCKCCSYVTFDKDSLIQHFKENHPRCICPECDFMAEYAYVIKRHMMRHTAIGCTCDICGKTYKDQYILKMHVKMVHMPAEVLFECTVCSKKFTRKAHLKRHLRIHEPEKPYKCPHCDYRGCERSDISKHILIHEEPRHVCEICGKAFRHMKNKFLHLKRHSGQRDYKCGVCDFFGYTFTDIRKHIERKHSEIKTLFCDKCGAAFKSEAILREHQKQQCEMFMIEQALSIATSTGSTSHATIQIPSSTLTMDCRQLEKAISSTSSGSTSHATIQIPSSTLTMDSRQLLTSLNNGSVNIQVEHLQGRYAVFDAGRNKQSRGGSRYKREWWGSAKRLL